MHEPRGDKRSLCVSRRTHEAARRDSTHGLARLRFQFLFYLWQKRGLETLIMDTVEDERARAALVACFDAACVPRGDGHFENRRLEMQLDYLIGIVGREAVSLPRPSDAEGPTLLHCCAAAGNSDGIALLLSRGADPNSRAGGSGASSSKLPVKSGATPLHYCARGDFTPLKLDAAMKLMAAGAAASCTAHPRAGGEHARRHDDDVSSVHDAQPWEEAAMGSPLRTLLKAQAEAEERLGLHVPERPPVSDEYTVTGPHGSLNVQICSDLHIEFYDEVAEELPDMLVPSAPVLGLLGDIGDPASPAYGRFLRDMAEKFELVLVLLGNHEYYSHEHARGSGGAGGEHSAAIHCEMHRKVRDICDAHPRLLLMHNKSIVVNGVRVIGSTLWSDIPVLDQPTVEATMNDYALIRKRGAAVSPDPAEAAPAAGGALRCITCADTVAWHQQAVGFITRELRRSTAAGEQASLVLTHHVPSMVGVASARHGAALQNVMGHGFATNLERMFRRYGLPKKAKRATANSNVVAWCCGHTHYNFDMMVHGTRLVSNQRGYRGHTSEASPKYDPAFVVNVGSMGKPRT